MEKYKEKVLKAFLGDRKISLEAKYRMLMKSVAFVHVCLMLIFCRERIWFLAFYNLLSVCSYLSMQIFIKKGKLLTVFNFSFFEICVHTYIVDLLLGWDFGFQLYVLALIPVSFYVAFTLKRIRNKFVFPVIYNFISFFIYVFCKIYTATHKSIFYIDDFAVQNSIYLFNAVVAFTMLLIFSFIFVLEMQSIQAKLQEKNDELNIMANYDPLTGLLNRRKMMEIMKSAETQKKEFSVILCDVDDFKVLNDTYGHDCGDQALIRICQIIKDSVQKPNMSCRWGGEEILLVSFGSKENAKTLAENIRLKIQESGFCYNGEKVRITMTLGVAPFRPQDRLDDVIIAADNNMYCGKHQGKNCIVA